MKLTKTQANKISEKYNLGKVKKIKTFKDGWVNHNFLLTTDKGKFVVQVLTRKMDDWGKGRVKLQFRVLEYLKKKGYPYEIPEPIKNDKGKYLSKVEKLNVWTYPYIEGEIKGTRDIRKWRKLVRAVALYNKYMVGFKNEDKTSFENFEWLYEYYKNLKKVKPKNKTDKLISENYDYFKSLLDEINKYDFGNNYSISHGDFHLHNVLFRNGKLKGIIDFDNILYAPRISDLTGVIKFSKSISDKKRRDILIKEYEKICKLNKKDKKMIYPLIMRSYCILFWWFYKGMKKNADKKYSSLFRLLRDTNRLDEVWKR